MKILELTIPGATGIATLTEGDRWTSSTFPKLTGGKFYIYSSDTSFSIYMVLNAKDNDDALDKIGSSANWSDKTGRIYAVLNPYGSSAQPVCIDLNTTRVRRIDMRSTSGSATAFIVYTGGGWENTK